MSSEIVDQITNLRLLRFEIREMESELVTLSARLRQANVEVQDLRMALNKDVAEASEHGRVGIAAQCAFCHRMKNPIGRSAAPEMANSLCDRECPGYDLEPLPGTLWPGETCEEFGFAHSHDATELQTSTKT